MVKLIPELFEFTLNNVQFISGIDNGTKFASLDMLARILRATAYRGRNLMKLKLSKMNLRNDQIVMLISKTIGIASSLISFDISWGQLLPKELAIISDGLARYAKSMRNLNLSYNRLNFDDADGTQKQDSERFMANIKDFFV